MAFSKNYLKRRYRIRHWIPMVYLDTLYLSAGSLGYLVYHEITLITQKLMRILTILLPKNQCKNKCCYSSKMYMFMSSKMYMFMSSKMYMFMSTKMYMFMSTKMYMFMSTKMYMFMSSKMYMFMSTKMWIRAVNLMLKVLLHCKVDLVLKINASFLAGCTICPSLSVSPVHYIKWSFVFIAKFRIDCLANKMRNKKNKNFANIFAKKIWKFLGGLRIFCGKYGRELRLIMIL